MHYNTGRAYHSYKTRIRLTYLVIPTGAGQQLQAAAMAISSLSAASSNRAQIIFKVNSLVVGGGDGGGVSCVL